MLELCSIPIKGVVWVHFGRGWGVVFVTKNVGTCAKVFGKFCSEFFEAHILSQDLSESQEEQDWLTCPPDQLHRS